MFPVSPFAHPVSSFPRPVPVVGVDPFEPPLVFIGVNAAWLPYIRGALKQLVLESTWDTSDPAAIELILDRAMTLLSVFSRPITELPRRLVDAEIEDPMSLCEMLRVQNGKLQALCCGEWVTIDGQGDTAIGAAGQPGGGTPQPAPGGGCQTYHATMKANGQWYMPTVVNAGDTVDLVNFGGAGSDDPTPGSTWYTPKGGQFYAGDYIESIWHTDGSDPLPTAHHMALIGNIAGTWYDLTLGPITVPGGVTNAAVLVQVNDSAPSNNPGDYSFDATVCNNQVATWTHSADFTLTPDSFVGGVDGSDGATTVWVPGIGWQSGDGTSGGFPHHYAIILTRTWTAATITQVIMRYTNSLTPSTTFAVSFSVKNGVTTVASMSPDSTGGSHVDTLAVAATADNMIWSEALDNNPTGVVTVTSWEISGTGTNPF